MIFGKLELFLTVVDRAEPIPCIVVAIIMENCSAKTTNCFVEVFVADQFMATKSVCVRVRLVQLQRSLEVTDSNVWLLLQREAITNDAPRLGSKFINVNYLNEKRESNSMQITGFLPAEPEHIDLSLFLSAIKQ